MSRLRGLRDSKIGSFYTRRPRRRTTQHGFHIRHRLCSPFPVLHGNVWLPYDPRPGTLGRNRAEDCQSRARYWVISGDGDALSIGGNHLLHLLRRNVDLQFLLFNNEIYGLTKGQYSPTSRPGTRSPSTPLGTVDNTVSAASFALGAGGRFVARSIDTLQKHMPPVLKRAHQHLGASFVEIFQNCIVYNDGIFDHFTGRDVAADTQIDVVHGEPLGFGADRAKGMRMKPGTMELEVVTIGEDGVSIDDILVHDETNRILASMLASMEPPRFPVAIGVLYCDPGPTYVDSLQSQSEAVKSAVPKADINDLLRSGHTWEIG